MSPENSFLLVSCCLVGRDTCQSDIGKLAACLPQHQRCFPPNMHNNMHFDDHDDHGDIDADDDLLQDTRICGNKAKQL